MEKREEDREYAEYEANKYLELAEAKLAEDRGKSWGGLPERDKCIWSELLMHLNDCSDCLGEHLSDVTKARISFIFKNYPEVDRTQELIMNEGIRQTLEHFGNMSQEERKEYYESYPNDEEDEEKAW